MIENGNITFEQPASSSATEKLSGDVERGLNNAVRLAELPAISAYSSFTAVDKASAVEDFSVRGRCVQYFEEEVDTKHTEVVLLVCSFISGVVDSAAFNAWGSFASMQTGNMVFLALGAFGQPPEPQLRWAKSLIAIATFMVSVLSFTYMSRWLGPLRRSTLLGSFGLQTAAVLASSVLVQTGVVDSSLAASQHGIDWLSMVPITLLALQAAGQIVTSRMVQVEEIPTVVLTTVLADLLIDPRLAAPGNAVRNRRVGTVLAFFGGAMVSGGLTKATGLSSSLWMATGLKALLTVCWGVWPHKTGRKGCGW